MCHAWIAHWTVARATLTMFRRRSTRDECTHGRNARTVGMCANPIWCAREPVWRLKRPYSNHGAQDERANQKTEHGKRSTYQIKRSQHIPVILHMRIEF